MSLLNKFKTNSYCVGGRHYSGTIKIRGVVSAKGTKIVKKSAAASRNPRAALSATPDLIKFATNGEGIKVVQNGRGLYLGTKKR